MKKTIEGLCAVLGAFLFAYLSLGCVRFAILSGYGEMLLFAVPACMGALICLLGLLDNMGIKKVIGNLFADKEDEL